jgi:prepilin-type processing-associated H-X9-DG protein
MVCPSAVHPSPTYTDQLENPLSAVLQAPFNQPYLTFTAAVSDYAPNSAIGGINFPTPPSTTITLGGAVAFLNTLGATPPYTNYLAVVGASFPTTVIPTSLESLPAPYGALIYGGLSGSYGPSVSGSRKITDITDGTSTTMILAEDAGRPAHWEFGQLVTAQLPASQITGTTTQPSSGAGWGDPNAEYGMDGTVPRGSAGGATCGINCDNNNEIYAFHPAGANILFCDGSVRLVASSTSIVIVGALTTAQGGENIPGNDY